MWRIDRIKMSAVHFVDNFSLPSCFPIFKELRPVLTCTEEFSAKIKQQQTEGYKIAAIFEAESAVACIGYRVMTTLAWGKILYVDDLITASEYRGLGYGKALLKFVIKEAKEQKCGQVHLDTGYTRHAAHRLYMKMGFELTCHHLCLNLES